MATRYSGSVRVSITYRDRTDDYAGTVSWPGGKWKFEQLRLSPFDRSRLAADSVQAYDRAAEAAIGFGSNEVHEMYGYLEPTDDMRGFAVGRRAR